MESANRLVLFVPDDRTAPMHLARELTAGERGLLEAESIAIDRSLGDRDDAATAEIVAGLLAGYGARAGSEREAAQMVAAYVAALRDQPPWAVDGAADLWRRGRAPNQRSGYRPSPDQMHDAAQSVTLPWRTRRYRIGRLLNAVKGAARPYE